jgi:hypothetical protein
VRAIPGGAYGGGSSIGLHGGNGTNGVGGGGGGGSDDGSIGGSGGKGGDGGMVLRYAGGPVCTGGVITQSGGYTIHTFTASDYLRVL